ncbi:Hypothetical_protein [Hexamita inflata]|uniref:Hypothetical_protein n=1 Tax=Hexamita inflata TaxID=28002 RepID=A0AA86QL30_9EUKA|nr:Hypothetical protein HINF_LOCUS47848 [Hexamita inflata]
MFAFGLVNNNYCKLFVSLTTALLRRFPPNQVILIPKFHISFSSTLSPSNTLPAPIPYFIILNIQVLQFIEPANIQLNNLIIQLFQFKASSPTSLSTPFAVFRAEL